MSNYDHILFDMDLLYIEDSSLYHDNYPIRNHVSKSLGREQNGDIILLSYFQMAFAIITMTS